MPKKIFSMKFRKYPKGPEKTTINKISKTKPYCSNKIITSVLNVKIAKSSFEPSSGGKGMRLKNAKRTFQKIMIIRMAKNIEPKDPETAAEICPHDAALTPIIMAAFTATGMEIIFATIAATSAIEMLAPGPPIATARGPHFWFLRLYGLYGTGFAHPNANPDIINIAIGTMIDPQISI